MIAGRKHTGSTQGSVHSPVVEANRLTSQSACLSCAWPFLSGIGSDIEGNGSESLLLIRLFLSLGILRELVEL